MKFRKLLPLMGLLAGMAWAHGDGADHATANLPGRAALPVAVAASERFEIVARLLDGELSIYIDRWASNQPVTDASVELEFDGRKAKASFHAAHGDYSLTDTAMLKALHAEGEHALVFTVLTPDDNDLLTATLHVQADADHHAGALSSRLLAPGGVILLLGVAGGLWWKKKNSRGGVA